MSDTFDVKKLHPLTKKLLKNRGVVSDKEIEKFLSPSYERDIGNPFTIYGMEKAVKRIIKAIKNEEMIAIYSDYDCDGIPGGVLLRSFFDDISYKNVLIYIPHRHNEGYGIHKQAIDKLKKEKVTLMITVDSGITNIDEVDYAQGLGIDVIVTDHHLPIEDTGSKKQETIIKKQIIPKAYVVINSKQNKCEYPDDMLCGCAVAWKLAVAILSTLRADKIATASFQEARDKTQDTRIKKQGNGRIPKAYDLVLDKVRSLPEGHEKWWLDLVAISTIADMVPLVNENRVLAHFGLKVLQKTRRHGLLHIFRNQNIYKTFFFFFYVAFRSVDRINAACRMGEPIQAHNMLYEKDSILAQEYVSDIEFLNNERKQGVKDILSTIDFDHSVYERDVIVVGNESWGPGVLGLIAQAIIEETGKPTFVFGQGEDKSTLKGSCRSLGDIHVVELMTKVMEMHPDLLLGVGGHEQAGGFSLSIKNKDKLLDAFNEAYKHINKKEITKDEIKIDEELRLSDINDMTYEAIKVVAPYGVGNPKPIFSFPKTKAVGVRRFGKAMEHIEVMYGNGVRQVKAIKFFADDELVEKLKKEHVLLAHFEKSYFRGKGELRLRVIDVM